MQLGTDADVWCLPQIFQFIEAHQKTFDKENPRDFVDHYLATKHGVLSGMCTLYEKSFWFY